MAQETAGTEPDDTPSTELLPCAEARHLVAFDVGGLLTVEQSIELITAWNRGVPPTPRPGTVEVAKAYRERGYEILYLVGLPATATINNMPMEQALDGWLTDNAYPTGEGAHYWFWDVAEGTTVWTSISNELIRLTGEGVSIDYGYTENPERAYGMATGGVPTEGLFTLESIPVEGQVTDVGYPPGPASTPLTGDDFNAHLATVNELPPACLVG